MKKALIISIVFAFLSCKPNQKTVAEPTPTVKKTTDIITEKTMEAEKPKPEFLTGIIGMDDLQQAPFEAWFVPAYENYQPNHEVVEQLHKLTDNVKITIFMGTWCEDSQQQVPRFYKILKFISFDFNKVTLIATDRSKKTPEHLEEGMTITHVPTFIIYKNEKEIQRIVETPVESLEKDLLTILSGKPYKHSYQK
ncbi:thioredoxin family protein [Flavobacterium sp. GT3R68]|uniref:thioredoxin family protein n=1 Tax=Flavobacterium sp. GT3R68 TaxID=2594437 RepID=UPI000F896A17|nr:thioredoxin family protein [Flavobacterium sp. GT3R68]RTY87532.1 thioredoxin family protein [Flavobacterium sp. GSN2]TRW90443.1 thioredoxin family protein [Flavobacterium sp. GT3R68]